jgi:hypothetical protein
MNINTAAKLDEFLQGYSMVNLNILVRRLNVSEGDLLTYCRAHGCSIRKRGGALWAVGHRTRFIKATHTHKDKD